MWYKIQRYAGFLGLWLLLIASGQADEPKQSSFQVISDMDATFKVVRGFRAHLTMGRAFAGMPELYRAFDRKVDEGKSNLSFVSAAPTFWVRKRFENLLAYHGLHPRLLETTGAVCRKKAAIRNILKSSFKPVDVILIGDNWQSDPEIYRDLMDLEAFRPRVRKVYIRRVKRRDIPDGQVGFFTAMDIAESEVAAGRITTEQALETGKAILRELRNVGSFRKQVLPKNYACPESSYFTTVGKTVELQDLSREIKNKIQKFCLQSH